MSKQLKDLYPDALLAIAPHPDTGAMLVGANVTLAMACCTIVLARQLELLRDAVNNIGPS